MFKPHCRKNVGVELGSRGPHRHHLGSESGALVPRVPHSIKLFSFANLYILKHLSFT